ncbi:MAG: NADH:ubiquinone reductase (Na(+)-transporting) subunit B [Acidobacteria bacterium]|nr:MAG: NADH:ubiquinone reductase (Na(+)-transporting) subunit B [Acidobacteriota bacterium]
MNALRKLLDSQAHHFEKGGKLEKLHPFYEAVDTFLYSPGKVTRSASHVRDAIDLKRIMITVVVALLPAVYMAMYNTGYQIHKAIAGGALPLDRWQTAAMQWLGLPFDPSNVAACIVHGALYYLPVLLVTFLVGGNAEALFAVVRRHEINEGFLVTGMLFPLVLPPTIPLWQVALGILFGVVVGKEIFGGTGMNVLNPALTARAFLFFAYPAEISGDKVWIAAQTSPDGYSGATALANGAVGGLPSIEQTTGGMSWWDAFLGLVPGSMGETSVLACLIGALILLLTGIGSWRIMVSGVAGTVLATLLLNAIGSQSNLLFNVPFWWHMVLGGWAFGLVFMATDPVSAAHSNAGKWVYGFLIGVLAIFIRVLNPAFPEGMMLAILFMNVFASLIDHFVIRANIRRRKARYAV